MKIYLAGSGWHKLWCNKNFFNFYRLESYHYLKEEVKYIKNYKSFLLDSGAFSYLAGSKNSNVNWDKYIVDYATFIKKHDIKLFFELDIDPIVGLKEVERYREKLEIFTGRKSIPVWHKSRGWAKWVELCKTYDYVAIGGIVTKEITRNYYSIFKKLLMEAKKYNTKVHGLGFTNLPLLKKYGFYSVDSTSWLSGNRFGNLYLYKGDGKMVNIKKPTKNKRLNSNKAANHNFEQWIKFSKYAERNL